MRAILSSLLVVAMLFNFVVPVSASQERVWIDVLTSVTEDAEGNLHETREALYGYYSEIPNVGQAFIVCDQTTGEETGKAYIPNIKLGEQEVLTGYEFLPGLDWDNPKAVNPPTASMEMPNVITSEGYDWDYWEETGEFRRIGTSHLTWPGSREGYVVAGDDPDNWLIVGIVTNNNPYPAKISSLLQVREWYDGDPIIADIEQTYGPHETKYILMNRGNQKNVLATYNNPWYSEGYYSLDTLESLDPAYPKEDLYKDGKAGLYRPYTRSYESIPQPSPVIPMRLSYEFRFYGKINGQRQYPTMQGKIIYDHIEKEWYVSEIEGWYGEATESEIARARQDICNVFNNNWKLTPPHFSIWSKDDIKYVDRATGEQTNYAYRGEDHLCFEYLEPKTPRGWEYSTGAARRTGYDMASGIAIKFNPSRMVETDYREQYGEGYSGFCRVDRDALPTHYYDPDGWMSSIPVLKREPMFVERYSFITTDSPNGYLVKNVEPAHRYYVHYEERPVINMVTDPVEINIYHFDSMNGSTKMWRHYKWTPAQGMKTLGLVANNSWTTFGSSASWRVNAVYKQKVVGENPSDVKVTFGTGSNMSVYWGNVPAVEQCLTNLADTVRSTGCNDPPGIPNCDGTIKLLTSLSVSSGYTTIPTVTLNPGQTKDITGFTQRTASVSFGTKTAAASSTLDKIQSTLTELLNKDDDACFGSNSYVTINSVDPVEEVVNFAQMTLIYEHDDRYSQSTIGKNYAPRWTDYSYFTSRSATDGVIARPQDAVGFTSTNLRIPMAEQWRLWRGGDVDPPDYVEFVGCEG